MTNHVKSPFSSPAVSVVIPLYNKRNHIKRAIQSVLDQTFRDFEVIVVNDGSSDGGAEIPRAILDPRVHVIDQANAGVSVARNKGIGESQTEMIAFLDADDEWKPTFLETVLRLSRRFPECGAFGTAWEMVDVCGQKTMPHYELPAGPWEGIIPNYFQCLLAPNAPLCSSAIAIPRRTFRTVGLFREGENIAEDLEMWFAIALKFSIAFSTRIEAVYRQDAENRVSFGIAPKREFKIINKIELAIRHGDYPQGVNESDLVEYRNRMIIAYAAMCVRSGQRATARMHLHRAVSTRTFIWSWMMWYSLSLVPNSSYLLLRSWRRFIRKFVLSMRHCRGFTTQ
jgi:glycosyltransferase involved in cell wall biosynthesis